MRIDPAVRALRCNSASQRAQSALERAKAEWREDDRNRVIFEQLIRFGQGDDLARCPALHRLLVQPGKAAAMTDHLVAKMLPEMAAHPLGQIPFRHQYSGGIATIQLAVAGQAALSLVMYERCSGKARVQTVCFTDSERYEIALAGAGRLQIVSRTNRSSGLAQISCRPMDFAAGQSLSMCGRSTAKFIEQVDHRLIILRLSRTAAAPWPSQEFRLSDGALVHQACADRRASRHEMMLLLLGRMGRRDAAPVMAQMARDGSDHVRWQALRECLALDTAQGFAALCAVARDPQDSLSANAGALHAQLINAHPRLALFEETLCPA